jgi:hypothetical protein
MSLGVHSVEWFEGRGCIRPTCIILLFHQLTVGVTLLIKRPLLDQQSAWQLSTCYSLYTPKAMGLLNWLFSRACRIVFNRVCPRAQLCSLLEQR